MQIRKSLVIFLAAVFSLLQLAALATSSEAAAYLYAGSRKKISCGILVVNATQPLSAHDDAVPGSGVGNLFFALDTFTQIKPAGWTFENPVSVLSASNQGVKALADYWMVPIDVVGDLTVFDFLYLPASGLVTFTNSEMEKLRAFVDSGGVLWIDNANPTTDPARFESNFLIQNLECVSGGAALQYPVYVQHPLLNVPYYLSQFDVSYLGATPGQCYMLPGYDPAASGWSSNKPVDYEVLLPVVNMSGGMAEYPTVAANTYGSGRIVATSNYVGKGCMNFYPGNPNLRFVYNMISWAASWTNPRKNPRQSATAIDTLGASKIVETWALSAPDFPGPHTPVSEMSPVVYKNIAFYTAGNMIFAMDIMPQEDLDRDGNVDDGLQDKLIQPSLPVTIDNKGQDIVWAYTASAGLSSPTIATVQDPQNPNTTMDVLLVTTTGGEVLMFNAFPTVAADTPVLAASGEQITLPTPFTLNVPPTNPYPPLYVNGWIYAIDGNARLHAYNPSADIWASTNEPIPFQWQTPSTSFSYTAEPAGGPLFAYVQSENTSAVLGMVYWVANNYIPGAGSSGSQINGRLVGVPVQVKNDKSRIRGGNKTADGKYTQMQIEVTYRRQGQIAVFPEPRVTIEYTDDFGVNKSYTIAVSDASRINFPAIGRMVINQGDTTESGTPLPAVPTNAKISVNYSIDYSDIGKPVRFMEIEPTSGSRDPNPLPQTDIVSTPTIGPKGTMYFCGHRDKGDSNIMDSGGDSVYAVDYDSNNQLTKWSYLMHSGAALSTGLQSSIVLPGVIDYPDPNNPGRRLKVTDIDLFASPVVADGKVFATFSGNLVNYDPMAPGSEVSLGNAGGLVCLKSRPTFQIRITENAGFGANGKPIRSPKRLVDETTGRPFSVRIWQPDLLTDNDLETTQPTSVLKTVPGNYIDYENGVITLDHFQGVKGIHRKGGPRDLVLLSPSVPIWVFLENNVQVPIDWSTWKPAPLFVSGGGSTDIGTDSLDLSGWNNMLWYHVVPDTQVTSSPVVIGDTVYFSDTEERLHAIDAATGQTDAGLASEEWVLLDGMPVGLGSMNAIPSAAQSNGVFLMPTSDGLHALSNTTTLVADASRILEVDASGEVQWSLDAVQVPASIPVSPDQAPAIQARPINRPARARYSPTGEIVIVNTGANMVCVAAKSGTVSISKQANAGKIGPGMGPKWIRSIYTQFADPKGLLRPGQPLKLSSPTDAIVWVEQEKIGGKDIVVSHCMIADSGNHRVLDLVYRFDMSNANDPLMNTTMGDAGFILPDLNWTTKTDTENQRYSFDCIQLVATSSGGAELWAAISNYATGADMTGTDLAARPGTGGAIVAIAYRQPVADFTWDYSFAASGTIVGYSDRLIDGGNVTALNGPKYLYVKDVLGVSGVVRKLYICDSNGVYETELAGGAQAPTVVNALTDQMYRSIDRDYTQSGIQSLGVPLQASSIQVLYNNRWLVTNSFAGVTSADFASEFQGEVFEYDPVAGEITWCSPSLDFDYTIAPYVWKQESTQATGPRQPRSAERRN